MMHVYTLIILVPQLSEHTLTKQSIIQTPIECSIRVFCQQVCALLE